MEYGSTGINLGGLLDVFQIFTIEPSKENLNIINSIFAFSVTVLIQGLISIIPGGLGVSDGGLIALLVLFGIEHGHFRVCLYTHTLRILK